MEAIQLPEIQLRLFAPELIVTATAVVVLLLDIMFERLEKINVTIVTLIGLAVASFSAWGLLGTNEQGFSGMLLRDNFSVLMQIILIDGMILVTLLSHRYAERHKMPYADMMVLELCALLGMMIVAVSADLVMLFIGIELLSISLYVLSGFDKRSAISGEASLKYFLLGAFSTGFLVYGLAFIFGICRTTNLIAIGTSVTADMTVPPLLLLGFALVLVGLGFKISLAPFHMWAPDVYQGAPTPVTAWIATGSKIAGFVALLRIFTLPGTSFAPISEYWIGGIWVLAMLTMILGNFGALAQTDIKRMLAYSSIAHGGYLSMAFVANNDIGIHAMVFYMFAYLLTTIGAFGVVIMLGREGEDRMAIADFAGLAKKRPVMAGLMSLFLLSLAGMPPTVGFFGKLWLFGAAMQSGYYVLAAVGILTTLLSFYYYLRVIVYMYMRDEEVPQTYEPSSFAGGLALWGAAFGVVILGIFPNLWWGYFDRLF